MNFDVSEEQELFRSSVERFAAPIDVEARRKLRSSPSGYDRERWRQLAELGLIALAASENAGGIGGSPVDLAMVAEAIGRANSPDPWLELGVLPSLLCDHGEADDALQAVLGGERIATLAWAERRQRYSLKPRQMSAAVHGGGFVLTGEKTLVLGAALADLFLVTAHFPSGNGGGFGCFLIAREAPGVNVRLYRLADGSIAGELKLTQVEVSANSQLALSQNGFNRVIATCRMLAAAEMVGLGQKLLDDTLTYVKQREQFGVAIGTFQALQHRLVEAYARIEQSRSMLYRAALTDPADHAAWARGAAGAKGFIAENVDAVAREAVQMHGGMGITDELAIGHAMKRVMVLARLFGDADTLIGEYALAA